jgi:hypothetical protein
MAKAKSWRGRACQQAGRYADGPLHIRGGQIARRHAKGTAGKFFLERDARLGAGLDGFQLPISRAEAAGNDQERREHCDADERYGKARSVPAGDDCFHG